MVRVFAVAFVLVLSVRVAHGQTPSVCGARDNGIIANPHAITYPRLPTQWAEGLPLGNGEIGVMCWSDGRRLRFTFDSAGAWVLRHKSGELDYSQLTYAKLRQWVSAGNFDAIREAAERMGEPDRLRPTKLYLGRLELDCEFEPDSELSLCVGDASVRGVLRGTTTSHQLHAFVCRTGDLFCVRLDPWPDGVQLKLRLDL